MWTVSREKKGKGVYKTAAIQASAVKKPKKTILFISLQAKPTDTPKV